MPRYYYVAQDKNNIISKGVLDASDRDKALKEILQKGLRPIKLDALTAETRRGGGKFFSMKVGLPKFLSGSLTTLDQLIIVRHLGIILSTGTDILSGLEIIAKDAMKPLVRQILYDIKERVSRGEKLSDALNKWRQQFNPIFISLVKSGELSGNLPGVLISYSQELRKDYNFARKLKGAIFYPAILISSLFAMIILILSIVAPRLKELFSSLKAEPPFYTKILFGASDILINHTVLVTILFVIFFLFIVYALKKRNLRLKLVAVLSYFPFLKKLQSKVALMRFSRTVASLIHAGFSLKAALLTTSEIVDIKYRKAIIEMVEKNLEHGISLADSMKKYPDFFPDILVSAVATGEKSGQLAVVLAQMAEFYEEDVIYGLETFLTILEPVLLLIVGTIIALLATSIIAPVYRLIGKFR
ncbi:MAG: type II secretion system F family protein [Patescibacteria group bacterium]|nr:type II secretion system F family protein [Patescibacteria group bacterium]